MRIGELARRSGVGVSTLRAWERRFGFLEPERTPAGHRVYSETDLERVTTALQLLGDGLTLPAAIAKATANADVLADGEGDRLLYGQILYAADDGVWVSRHGRTRYVNRRMAELMQMPAQDLLARSALDFFDEIELPAARERASRLQRGERVQYRQWLRRPSGTTFLADIKATPLLNAAGGYEGTVALVQDVTAIAEAERTQALRDALLDGVSDAVAASAPDGTVLYVNTAAEHLFGWRAADVVGRNGIDVLAAPDSTDEAERIFERLATGKRYAGFIRLARNDGTTFLAHANAKPIYADSGEIVGYVTTISDRSVHQQLERSTRSYLLRAETLAQLGAQALQHLDDLDATRALVAAAIDAAVHVLDADRALTFDEDTLNGFAMYVRRGGRVIVLDDTELDRRFGNSFADTTRSAIGAPILGPGGIRAVLVVEGRTVGQFGDGASYFVEGIANVIGCALLHDDAVADI